VSLSRFYRRHTKCLECVRLPPDPIRPTAVRTPAKTRPTPRRPGESQDPLHRWAPAFAGVTREERGRASKASNAPKRERQAGKQSEAARQSPHLVVLAKARTHCTGGHGVRRCDERGEGASEQSEQRPEARERRGGKRAKRATPRSASDRQASKAKPPIKPHASPAPPGDPWRPSGAGAKRLGGQKKWAQKGP